MYITLATFLFFIVSFRSFLFMYAVNMLKTIYVLCTEKAKYCIRPSMAIVMFVLLLLTPPSPPNTHIHNPTLYATKKKVFPISLNQLHIPCPTPNTPPPNRTPPYNPHVPSLHFKPTIRALDKNLAHIPQRTHEHGFVLVWLVYHANATSSIIKTLQRGRELG